MDESKKSDCVDQYGESRIPTLLPPARPQHTLSDQDSNAEPTDESLHLTDEFMGAGEVAPLGGEDPAEQEAAEREPEEDELKSGEPQEAEATAAEVPEPGGSGRRARQPKKRSFAEEDEEEEGEGEEKEGDKRNGKAKKSVKESGEAIKLGDIVWGRLANSCFYPAVVTLDHFKFFTKIVKAEPGFSSHDPETGKARPASPDKPAARKQYHVQFLGDNRRHWLSEEFVIAFQGACRY
jgi:hypothetical protein